MLTNNDILPILNAFSELSEAFKGGPIKRSFAVSKWIKKFKDLHTDCDDARKAILTDGALRDESNNPVFGKDDKGNPNPNHMLQADQGATNRKLEELYKIEVDCPKGTHFTIQELEADGVKLSAIALMVLDFMIHDADEKTEG